MLRTLRFPSPEGWTQALVATFLVAGACATSFGCLRRPVAEVEPTNKISFETVVPQPAIDKIDLLVMVDNSSSMLDKQRILADAVPDLVKGLIEPKCVDPETRRPTGPRADPTRPDAEMCPRGSEPAFPPITDMHIGVISSSLGSLGSSSCPSHPSRHNDDRGHLLARGERGDVAATGDLGFLAWYPDVAKNRDKARHPDPEVPKIEGLVALETAFRELVVGVGQEGCGLEAQLESVYRFLVQPDPWTEITRRGLIASYGPPADVDAVILRQRAAFLRPDSLVAIIMLTDEDDSSADPLSFRGTGWQFMEESARHRATAACAEEPASVACTSCAFAPDAPGCSPPVYAAAEDDLNVRFHDMKRRFGVEPQFPVQRYVDALTRPRVPLRGAEHDAHGRYAPTAACTNPLFAARLPTSPHDELCQLPRGPRSRGLVYLGLIGGVPNQLLPQREGEKIDWTRLLGRDPARWDTTGIDPHMVQSTAPRAGLPPPSAADDADPIHGREWETGGKDLQFACTFDLYERSESGARPVRRACGDEDLCDCIGTSAAPLCASDDRRVQVRGKAYPTRRQLMVAKELDEQAIVASLCPTQLTALDADDYGYRPAVRAITTRLERSLVGSCLPRQLERQDDGRVSCLVLALLPDAGPDAACERFGLQPPPADLLDPFRRRLADDEGEEAARHPVCVIPQITVPKGAICRDASAEIAFCYVEAEPITHCAHALAFTKASAELTGARFTMQCIQQSSAR